MRVRIAVEAFAAVRESVLAELPDPTLHASNGMRTDDMAREWERSTQNIDWTFLYQVRGQGDAVAEPATDEQRGAGTEGRARTPGGETRVVHLVRQQTGHAVRERPGCVRNGSMGKVGEWSTNNVGKASTGEGSTGRDATIVLAPAKRKLTMEVVMPARRLKRYVRNGATRQHNYDH
ncbi:hypothetical protein RhiJN_29017 [Ceratobasidium sp. AG-Ba]|nr:hypothetical protein RhiJN_29017 [Ceratobasidium sp. AG-Ba]